MRVGIFGAGAIGCYVGTQLSAASEHVVFLGRPALLDIASELAAVSLDGVRVRPHSSARFTADPGALADIDICLLTVKSQHTTVAANTLAEVLPSSVPVVSFQNGLQNPARLRARLPNPIIGGVVTFNVFWEDNTLFQATRGDLFASCGVPPASTLMSKLRRAFDDTPDRLQLQSDVERVMAGKLLLNLNNGICAATGMSIQASIRSLEARKLLASCISEGIDVMRATGLRPKSPLELPLALILRLLRLPDAILNRAAKTLVNPDPRATSSTLQDLRAGKETEIDDLNGEILRRGKAANVPTPVNGRIVEAIREHEAQLRRGALPQWVPPARLL